ncbi:hypothetical protein DSO57_1021891 [Entomophthora muscae]|uniref:Uncharacterized protein n=1 Tax=Entomophthora muscae TaxID=34485 RepID=A0ACC2T3D6_9FUNG|nr:hypothetical protein DSO57_1021891 [Entomophthora muscae]
MIPFEVLYGVDLNLPRSYTKVESTNQTQMMQNKRETNQENLVAKTRQMQARDHTQYKLPKFKFDQYVMLFKSSLQNSKSKKFMQKWSGPFQIASIAPNYNYFLKDMDGNHLPNMVNGTRLKEYCGFV